MLIKRPTNGSVNPELHGTSNHINSLEQQLQACCSCLDGSSTPLLPPETTCYKCCLRQATELTFWSSWDGDHSLEDVTVEQASWPSHQLAQSWNSGVYRGRAKVCDLVPLHNENLALRSLTNLSEAEDAGSPPPPESGNDRPSAEFD